MMRLKHAILPGAGLVAAASLALAQGPGGFGGGRPPESPADTVARLMAFDADKDGKLTKSELSDPRLQRLFDRADADKDGSVMKEELTALAEKEQADDREAPGFGPPPGGPGIGPPGGFGGPMMPPPRPGEVLPPNVRRDLNLTEEQQEQLDALQKDVDERLAKLLTDEQEKTLEDMRRRPPAGPGGFPGGRGRPPGGPGRGGPR